MTTTPVPTITDDLIAELEMLAGKATPGPWLTHAEHDSASFQGYYVANGGVDMLAFLGPENQDSTDADYIATANPATILALLAERAELKRDAERYHHALETIKMRGLFFVDDDADMKPHSVQVLIDIADKAMQEQPS